MPRCKDQQTTYLRDLGYNVISLPRAGIRPLTVAYLGKSRRVTELGYLPEVWTSSAAEPRPEGGTVARMGGQRTSKLDGKVGIDILGNLIAALGGNGASVKTAFAKASTLEFSFKDVERERVTPLALGAYVERGKLSSQNPFVRRYFTPRERLYVIVEVLKSSGFGVTAMTSSSTGLELQIPAIQQAVAGSSAIKVDSKSQGTIEFDGAVKLPFAFIAARLIWNDNRWEAGDFPQPGEIHLGSDTRGTTTGKFGEPRDDGAVLFGDDLVDLAAADSD